VVLAIDGQRQLGARRREGSGDNDGGGEEAATMVLAASSELLLLLLLLVLSAVSLSSQCRDGRAQARLGVLTRVQSTLKGCARH